jgi:predicted component of type VI protein secretion system
MMPSTASNTLQPVRLTSTVVGTMVGLTGMYKYATITAREGESLVVGRDAVFAHLVIDVDAEKVSRKHCEVRFLSDDKGWQVTDFSTNGTFLADGRRLEKDKPTRLPSGTEIALGTKGNRFLLSSFSGLTESIKQAGSLR